MESVTACRRATGARSQSRTVRRRPRRLPTASSHGDEDIAAPFPIGAATSPSPPTASPMAMRTSPPRVHSGSGECRKKWFRGGCKPNFVFPVRRRRRRSFVSAADTRNRAACAAPERAVPRFPIWPCSRGGFPCPDACAAGGGLLPRLFTLTADRERPAAVCFLWHCLSTRPCGRISRVYPRLCRGYAAPCPGEFGLSSRSGAASDLPPPRNRRHPRPQIRTKKVKV